MLEPDWNQERPETTVAALRGLWDALRIERCADVGPAVERLLSALRETHVNGGAEFGMFSVASSPAFRWFMSRNRWDEIAFPEHFLRSRTVATALSELCREPVSESFGFEWGNAFTLAGELADALSTGGAYVKHAGGPGNAFGVADDFRKWLFGDRFDEVLVLKSIKPWSAWFCDVAWDGTWLVVDKRKNNASVLAVTDTD
jgi:hypothetical protein